MHSQSLLRAWQITALSLAAISAAVLILNLAYSPRVVVPGAEGFLGYDAAPTHFKGRSAHRITGFEPESPLPSAGVKTGDLIVDPLRGTFMAGETVTLQIVREGAVRRVQVKAARIDRLSTPVQNVLDFALVILVFVLGLTIALRRRDNVGALVLASVFIMAVAGLVPNALPAGRVAGVTRLWQSIIVVQALPMLAYFSLVFEGGYQSRASVPRQKVGACCARRGSAKRAACSRGGLSSISESCGDLLRDPPDRHLLLGKVACTGWIPLTEEANNGPVEN